MKHGSSGIARAGLMIALTVVLHAFSLLPVIALPVVFLLPVPLILYIREYGIRMGIASVFCVSVLLFMLHGPLSTLFYLPFGMSSVVLGGGLFFGMPPVRTALFGSFFLAFFLLLELRFSASIAGLEFSGIEQMKKMKTEVSGFVEERFLAPLRTDRVKVMEEYKLKVRDESIPVEKTEELKRTIESMDLMEKRFVGMLSDWDRMFDNPWPYFLSAGVISQFLYLILVYMLCARLLWRLFAVAVPRIDFLSWSCPTHVSYVFLAVIVSLVFIPGIQSGLGRDWVLSFGAFMQMTYFLFGLSFVSFFLYRWKISGPVRVVALFLGIIFMNILVFVGIFDSLFKIRQAYTDSGKGA